LRRHAARLRAAQDIGRGPGRSWPPGAIAIAGDIDALARALKDNDQQLTRIRQELAALDSLPHMTSFDVNRVERDLRKRLEDWRGLLKRQMPYTRQILSQLLDGRIAWTPRRSEGLYEFKGRAKFDQLLSGIVVTLTQGMVAVRGFETSRHPMLAVSLDFDGAVRLAA
jgi:hypothetical protein